RIRRVERGTVRVEDAEGQPPNVPFWLGEAPGRSDELSAAVSRLRHEIDTRLLPLENPSPPFRAEREGELGMVRTAGVSPAQAAGTAAVPNDRSSIPHLTPTLSPDGGEGVISWLTGTVGIDDGAACQILEYL